MSEASEGPGDGASDATNGVPDPKADTPLWYCAAADHREGRPRRWSHANG
jgi:hypothetical protein